MLLLVTGQGIPPVVQAPVPGVATCRGLSGCLGPPVGHGFPGPVQRFVMPCGLDEQPAGMGIPGLRDPSNGSGGPRGVFAGHQATIGRDGAAREPVPVV